MPRTLTPFERLRAADTMTADDMRWALRYLAGHAAGPLDLALASAAVRRRRMPAEPVAAGDVWLDSHGCRWFAVETGDRFGNTKIQLTRTGGNTASVSSVHQDCVLVTRLFSGATPEEEA